MKLSFADLSSAWNRRKDIHNIHEGEKPNELKKCLNAFELISFGVGSIIGYKSYYLMKLSTLLQVQEYLY